MNSIISKLHKVGWGHLKQCDAEACHLWTNGTPTEDDYSRRLLHLTVDGSIGNLLPPHIRGRFQAKFSNFLTRYIIRCDVQKLEMKPGEGLLFDGSVYPSDNDGKFVREFRFSYTVTVTEAGLAQIAFN